MLPKLLEMERRFEGIETQLQDPAVASNPRELKTLGKARRELEPIVEAVRRLKKIYDDLEQAEALYNDPEMREMAYAEADELKAEKAKLEEDIRLMLIPKDPNDDKSVIIEIRPAAGGDEAGLFAAELFRMYSRYAERRRWKVSVMDIEETGIGGITGVTFEIDAEGAYSQLKHESGVHRVQRVPKTESGGRIHTSTVTVAVLPEAEDVEIAIRSEDLEISTFCSSSAGGQHMQKNETAIRIIHKPTGLVSTCQDERSQAQNKEKAMNVLKAKLYEMEQDRLAKERGELRKGQVGSGDRSEKIRTYNFPQDRITDHRIGMDCHNVPIYMDGDIQKMLDALVQEEQAKRILESDQN